MTATPSDRVKYLVECGAMPIGPFAVWPLYHDDYAFLDLYAGERHVQMYVSPKGRSVRVFVDGKEATT